MADSYPFFDVQALHAPFQAELEQAAIDVIRSGAYINGPAVRAFEEQVAAYLDVPHAIGCNSGTDALVLALIASGVGPGDEVLVPSWTFFATSESVVQVGAVPVFVDIDLDSFLMSVEGIKAAITEKTKAIIPVHLYGRALVLDPLWDLCAEKGIAIVEDTAQAFGGTYGVGQAADRQTGTRAIGAFSFFPTKNLGGCGDGGLVTTHDDAIADKVRMLRAHGGKHKYRNEIPGFNSRLDSLQAALLSVKLPHVDGWNQNRVRIAKRYNAGLAALGCDVPEAVPGHVFHQYTILLPEGTDRDGLQAKLKEAGVPSMVYYPVPNHKLPVFETVDHIRSGKLPHTMEAAARALSLPVSPTLQDAEVDDILDRFSRALSA